MKIQDYRAGDDVVPRAPQTVEVWINQFDARGQIEILKFINHALARTAGDGGTAAVHEELESARKAND